MFNQIVLLTSVLSTGKKVHTIILVTLNRGCSELKSFDDDNHDVARDFANQLAKQLNCQITIS